MPFSWPPPAAIRVGAGAAGVLAYASASSWLMTNHPRSPLSLIVALGPMVVAILAAVWREVSPRAAFGVAIFGALVVAWVMPGATWSPQPLYLAEHAGFHAALGLFFALTLRPGRTPLVTRMAVRLHRLTADALVYTRRCTIAWVVYFAAMSLASLAIYRWAPFSAWTLFANFMTPTGVLLMLVGEYSLRYRLHPEFERVAFASAWQAWKADHGEQTIGRSGAAS
jgi:uncharacterized membrane protein